MNTNDTELARASAIVAEPVVRYDNVSIVLHWVTAGLIILLWIIAQVIDDFARGTPRIMARSVHITLGVTLAAVIVVRLAWRASSRRQAPLAVAGPLGIAARIVHYALYALVIGAVVLGITNVWTRGDTIFEWFTVPKLSPGNSALKKTVEDLHAWFANTVLVVAGVHAAAGLFHRLVHKENVLRRMLPQKMRK